MISLKYTIKDLEAKTALKGLSGRLSNPQPALKECGLVLLRSISKNFKQGGRPDKWQKSARAKKEGGKTLVDTARLKNSITMKVEPKKLTVGSNVIYAAIHDLGGNISKNVLISEHRRHITQAFGKPISGRKVLVRAHQRRMNLDMPQREFLIVQDEDYRIFTRIFQDYLTK